MKSKTCTKCLVKKSIKYFYKMKRYGKIGYSSRCGSCIQKIIRDTRLLKYKDTPTTVKDLNGEVWRDVLLPGFNGQYKISNYSRMKSLPNRHYHTERIIKTRVQYGRSSVSLSFNGLKKTFAFSRIVAKAFIPNPNKKQFVHHKNNNPADNRIENLEWVTPKENLQYASSQGRMQRGQGRFNSVLTENQVLDIFNSKESGLKLAIKYKVTSSNIHCIKSGKSWSYITGKKYAK